MTMAIDAQLSSSQPDVADYVPAERRRLAAVTLANAADFEVEAANMATATAAQTSLTTARGSGGALDAAAVIDTVTTALRAREDHIGTSALDTAVAAVAAATVTAAVPTVATVTPAPAAAADSSGAAAHQMLGSMAVFMTVFWLLTC